MPCLSSSSNRQRKRLLPGAEERRSGLSALGEPGCHSNQILPKSTHRGAVESASLPQPHPQPVALIPPLHCALHLPPAHFASCPSLPRGGHCRRLADLCFPGWVPGLAWHCLSALVWGTEEPDPQQVASASCTSSSGSGLAKCRCVPCDLAALGVSACWGSTRCCHLKPENNLRVTDRRRAHTNRSWRGTQLRRERARPSRAHRETWSVTIHQAGGSSRLEGQLPCAGGHRRGIV